MLVAAAVLTLALAAWTAINASMAPRAAYWQVLLAEWLVLNVA